MGTGIPPEQSACEAECHCDQKRCLGLLELNVSRVGKGADVEHQRLVTCWFSQMRELSLANCPSLANVIFAQLQYY